MSLYSVRMIERTAVYERKTTDCQFLNIPQVIHPLNRLIC